MCGDPEYHYVVCESREHKARKPHVCCACKEEILPGHQYVSSFAKGSASWSEPERYKHCLRCWEMLQAIMRELPDAAVMWELNCGQDWLDTIGDLPDEVAALAFLSQSEAQDRFGKNLVHRIVST
jgi:hypothetical protein